MSVQITTYAGSTFGSTGDGGPATSAQLYQPWGIAVDSNGNVVFSDTGNFKIRLIAKSSGIISTYAGTGASGSNGDGGAATSAQFSSLRGIAADTIGNVYIADYNNNKIRMVNSVGIIITIAGNGFSASTGDGGMATSASLYRPEAVCVDNNNGNVYISDTFNGKIRFVTKSTGIISTFVVVGAALSSPQGIAIDNYGYLYVADGNNNIVRVLNSATGTGGGLGWDFGGFPSGVAVDKNGDVFMADNANNKVQMMYSSGFETTLVGTGSSGSSGDGGPAITAQLYSPNGVAVDNSGNIFIADSNNNKIRVVRLSSSICPGGSYLSGSSCSYCTSGTYSVIGSTICTSCLKGSFSLNGASMCTTCSAGTYSVNTGLFVDLLVGWLVVGWLVDLFYYLPLHLSHHFRSFSYFFRQSTPHNITSTPHHTNTTSTSKDLRHVCPAPRVTFPRPAV